MVFARYRLLQKNDIKLMWDAVGFGSCSSIIDNSENNDNSGKKSNSVQHESVTSAVFDLILGLVNTSNSWYLLGVEIFSYLANLFSKVRDCNWWTTQSLGIVESVVHRSIDLIIGNILLGMETDEQVVPAGMDVLWSLAQDNNGRKKISTDAFPLLMQVIERVLTKVKDELTTPANKVENSKKERENEINEITNKVILSEITPATNVESRLADNSSFFKARLAMQKLQTYFIRRAMETINMKDNSSCPTATIRIMFFVMNFLPIRVEGSASQNTAEKENEEEVLFLTVEDILRHYDLGAILIKEMVHFGNETRTIPHITKHCKSYRSSTTNDGQCNSHSGCLNFRLELFQLIFSHCVELHLLSLQSTGPSINDDIIPLEDVCIKKRKRNLMVQRQCDEDERISKRPILIGREECEDKSPINSTENSYIKSAREFEGDEESASFFRLEKLHPTPDDLLKIWSIFISNAVAPKSMDLTLNMFYCLLSLDFCRRSIAFSRWKENIAETIYPLCCNLHPQSISEAGYKLLIYCHGFMNVADGNFSLVTINEERDIDSDIIELSNILLGLSYGKESKQKSTICSLFTVTEPCVVKIRSYQLCGLNMLWSIILEGDDENVADMCMIYMAVLNAYTSINADQQISFIQRCMTELNKNGSGKIILMKKKRMLRLIRLYTEYVMRSCRSKVLLPQADISHGHHTFQVLNELHTEEIIDSALPFDIMINVLDGPQFKIFCPIGRNTTVFSVRESICNHFTSDIHSLKKKCLEGSLSSDGYQQTVRDKTNFGGKEFRLIVNGIELMDDMAKLGNLQISEESTVYCCPRMCTENIKKRAVHVVENTRQDEKPRAKCFSTLSESFQENSERFITPGIATLISPSCIDSFFSFFSPDVCHDTEDKKQLCTLVWDLLQLLPTEPQLQKDFNCIENHHKTTCEAIPWEKWLPTPGEGQSTAHFRLLYGLHLVEAFVLHRKEKNSLSSNSEARNNLISLEEDTADGTSDDDVVIVKEMKNDIRTSPSSSIPQFDDRVNFKKRAFIIMDENDDCSPNKKHLNRMDEIGSFKVKPDKEIIDVMQQMESCGSPRQWCNNFVSLGGLQHLVHLFKSSDLSLRSLSENSELIAIEEDDVQSGRQTLIQTQYYGKIIDSVSIPMACVNKILFLIRVVSTHSIETNPGNLIMEHLCIKQNTGSASALQQFLHHLLTMVRWAVEFQTFGQKLEESICSTPSHIPVTASNCSTFLGSTKISSVEVGASVAIQCLFLVKMLSKTTGKMGNDQSQQEHLVLSYCALKRNGGKAVHSPALSRAMVSSVVESPSPHVRSLALSVFRLLLCLREPNGATSETIVTNRGNPRLRSFAFSVLISLLPIIRCNGPESKPSFDFNSRTTLIFDLVVNCLSDMWLNSSEELRKDAVNRFVEYFRCQFKLQQKDSVNSSLVPTISGIRDIRLLFAWLVDEVSSLAPREYRVFSRVGVVEDKHQCDLPVKVMVDSYLVGLLSLMHAVVKILDSVEIKCLIGNIHVSGRKVILHLLFDKCAFLKPYCWAEEKDKASSAFISPQLRDTSLDLLRTLCKDCNPNLNLLLSSILDQNYLGCPRKDLIHDWNVDLALKQKSVTGHVGMKNQGATCYMNSLLQQFFHTPALRQGLLSCDLHSVKSTESDSIGEGYKLLHELQSLFGNLLLSEKRDFDTSELVKSIRGYDGSPIRPGEQQDVDEFFNLFCDRLETALKAFPQHRLLHDVFGGQLSHLITCQQCKYSSERVEDFLSISLDVKGKKNILESLDLYIQGEVLDGSNKYFCSRCKVKRDTLKRCCIKTLPNVLICHLKRFEFDLETLRKVKVNDRCEFPFELNMKKYTKEGMNCTNRDSKLLSWRTDKYYNYNLRGVLVHTGTADSGHYYSLARVQQKDGIPQESNENQWFCFNDSTVTPFDSTTLEATTFGGSVMTENSNPRPEERQKMDLSKCYSAYLLIYEREEDYSFDEQVNCSSSAPSLVNFEKLYSRKCLSQREEQWRERIICENKLYNRDQTLFAPAYSFFLIDLTQMSMGEEGKSKISPRIDAIQLLTSHLLENLVHAKDRNFEVEKIISILSHWYKSCLSACSWFLEKLITSHQIWVDKILLHCYVPETRRCFVKLLSVIFLRMAPTERDDYFCEMDCSVDDRQGLNYDSDDYIIVRTKERNHSNEVIDRLGRTEYWKSKSVLARFVGICLLDRLEGCDVHWRRFDQLFECLLAFSSCGQEEAFFLIRCGTILRLVDIYLEQNSVVPQNSLVRSPNLQSTAPNAVNRRVRMGDKYKKPNFFPLLKLLGNLVCSAMVVIDDNISDSDTSTDDIILDSDKSDRRNISSWAAFYLESSFLTTIACDEFVATKIGYELPQRDGWQVSRPDFFEKMLDEPFPSRHVQESQALTCSTINGKYSRTSSSTTFNDATSIICIISCHLCRDNFDLSLKICSVAKRLLEERKADEFNYALNVLASMLHIKDKHVKERISCILTAIYTGIQKNSTYERETVRLLNVLRNELCNRMIGESGTEGQVIFHENILKNLDDIVLPSISGETSLIVKKSATCLIRSLLPLSTDFLASYRDGMNIRDYQTLTLSVIDVSQYSAQMANVPEEQSIDESRDGFCKKLNVGSKPCDLKRYLNEDLVKDKVFSTLKYFFDTICETVASQSTRAIRNKNNGITMQARNRYSESFDSACVVDSTALSEYFEALRICLSGSKALEQINSDSNWIFETSVVLLRLLWKIDEEGRMDKRPSTDVTKGEILLLFERLLQLDPDQCVRALQSDVEDSSHPSSTKYAKDFNSIVHDQIPINSDPTTKMMEMYVTNSGNNANYNNKYMSHYYSILLLLADFNEEFCHSMLSHDNWRWALKSFVLNHTNSDPGKLYKVILNGTIKHVRENSKFRKIIFRYLMKPEGKDSYIIQDRMEIGSMKLLFAIFDCEVTNQESRTGKSDANNLHCISQFVQVDCGGMSKLSSVLKRSITVLQEADSKKSPPGIVVLQFLSLSLQCMYLTLSSFGIMKVREIMEDCWTEVDDVNFMLTQIKSRTDNEWEKSYQVSRDAKLIVMQIVTQATEVLTILASVEVAAQAVRE